MAPGERIGLKVFQEGLEQSLTLLCDYPAPTIMAWIQDYVVSIYRRYTIRLLVFATFHVNI